MVDPKLMVSVYMLFGPYPIGSVYVPISEPMMVVYLSTV